jgi:hypothetical protein
MAADDRDMTRDEYVSQVRRLLVEGERLEWPEELRVFLKEPVDFWRIRKLLPQK